MLLGSFYVQLLKLKKKKLKKIFVCVVSTPRDPLTPEELNGWMALFPDVDSSLAGVSICWQ